jgi:hypothetical protein
MNFAPFPWTLQLPAKRTHSAPASLASVAGRADASRLIASVSLHVDVQCRDVGADRRYTVAAAAQVANSFAGKFGRLTEIRSEELVWDAVMDDLRANGFD